MCQRLPGNITQPPGILKSRHFSGCGTVRQFRSVDSSAGNALASGFPSLAYMRAFLPLGVRAGDLRAVALRISQLCLDSDALTWD